MTKIVIIDYTNYRGERRLREIEPLPKSLDYGSDEFHLDDQWLLPALDVERQVVRNFAVKNIHAWYTSWDETRVRERRPTFAECQEALNDKAKLALEMNSRYHSLREHFGKVVGLFERFLDEVALHESQLNDAKNDGLNARPPTGDDYNDIMRLLPTRDQLAALKKGMP